MIPSVMAVLTWLSLALQCGYERVWQGLSAVPMHRELATDVTPELRFQLLCADAAAQALIQIYLVVSLFLFLHFAGSWLPFIWFDSRRSTRGLWSTTISLSRLQERAEADARVKKLVKDAVDAHLHGPSSPDDTGDEATPLTTVPAATDTLTSTVSSNQPFPRTIHCKKCSALLNVWTCHSNRNGNYGRSYYKCDRCSTFAFVDPTVNVPSCTTK